MVKLKAFLPFAGLAGLAASAAAGPTGPTAQLAYVTNYVQQLMRIDMQTPATVLIGNIGFAAQGLAATSSGRLYATNNAGNLFDITGAVVTPVAPLGALDVGALDSAGSTLWGWDNNSKRLFEYDPVALAFVQWSPVLAIPNIEAMAINPAGDFLFISNAGSVDKFGKITNGTWGVTLINPNMGLPDHTEAMDFLPNGKLYAAVLQDYRYEINPLTGAPVAGFWSGTHRDWAGMTAVPVPEPGSMLALAAGLGLLVQRRRSR